MDLLQLEHFLAIVDERTFTRAAERVGRTQSAVSQSVKKLEDELGTTLFARDAHGVSLTAAGRALAVHARRMVHTRDDALRELRAISSLGTGTLTIAAHESAAVYLLPAPLRAYLKTFPDIQIGLYRSRLADIAHKVMDREVDIGFVTHEPCMHGLVSVDVHADEMVLVAAPQHPLASRPSVSVPDLAGDRFILHHLCSATGHRMLRVFEDHQTRCQIAAELWSFENIKDFVRAEVGIAVVPRATVARELRDGSLVRIHVPQLQMPRRTLMVHREQGALSCTAREFIRIVRHYNWDAAPGSAPEATD